MKDTKRKLATAIATGALLLNAFAPLAFANTTITIIGNAADSDNDATVKIENKTEVKQDNTANFTNNIDADADTGDNDANRNNGGDVTVETGDATVNATVNNAANQNYANVDCCAQGDMEVKIANNGDNSNNTVNVTSKNGVKVDQDNDADFDNNIKYLNADTGNNDANRNNGGNVTVDTGNATVKVAVNNWANANSAVVGGNGGSGGTLSVKILNNAADSDNDITLKLEGKTNVEQDNDAYFDNNIDADADTGDNDANRNNGGDVEINTGDATVDVAVDNMANFNWVDLNCGCLFGEDGEVIVSVDGNGDYSDNNIDAELKSEQKSDQDNDADFDNDVKNSDADTGNNDANRNNAGGEAGDPTVDTGNADVNVDVSNSANVNGDGGEAPDWPDLNLGGLNISISFNLGDLLDALGH